jgi:plasmid stabilization system protein ParE
MAVKITKRAGADLRAIREYIGKDNPAAASRVAESWPGESEQGLKWIFCLNLAMIAIEQERL